jgi:hypothetical protein
MKNHRLLGASELAFEPLLRDPEGLLGAMQLSKTSDKVNANVGCT